MAEKRSLEKFLVIAGFGGAVVYSILSLIAGKLKAR